MKNKRLITETPQWNNRQPALRVPAPKVEKKYRTRSLFQSDLFLLVFIVMGVMAFTLPVSAANITHNLPATQELTVNKTFTLNSGGGTPSLLWFSAIIIGILMILLSFHTFPNGEEGLVSIAAWLPIAYAMFKSMSVDVITNAGTVVSSAGITQVESHTIYQLNTEAILLLVVLAAAIGNTWRIWVSQKKMKELSDPEPMLFDY
jgi:hypothetical protein